MKDIFDKQRELMEKFEKIEYNNRSLEWCGPIEEKYLDSIPAQMKLRRYAWQITEEIGELLEAIWCGYINTRGEVADVFHFLVELFIHAGVEPGYVTLEQAFDTQPPLPRKCRDLLWLEVIVNLAKTMNLLRNRPWKQTLMPTSKAALEPRLRDTFDAFIRAVQGEGLTAQQLRDAYFGKAETNANRIVSGI